MNERDFAFAGWKRLVGPATYNVRTMCGVKALTDVTFPELKGPNIIDSDGTEGTVAGVKLFAGDFLPGILTSVEVPDNAEAIVFFAAPE